MLNPGLILRAWRETRGATLVFFLLVGLFSGLLAFALPRVQERFLSRARFVPPQLMQVRNALLGVDTSTSGVTEIAYSLAWSHPIVLALLFAHAILVTTRVPAGEIERGTMDVLLGLPISRWQLFINETAAWFATGGLVLSAMFIGCRTGSFWVKPEYHPSWPLMGVVLTNLAFVYLVIGTVGCLASAFGDRRGRAVLIVLVVAVGSLLLSFLESLWDPAKRIGFLSILHYYRPAVILQSAGAGEAVWPWRNLAVLAGAAATAWTIAGVKLARRDLATT
jgi:hypothetical protein